MAKKGGKVSGPAIKISFGKRREGKHQKSHGPKCGGVKKKYRGQGR
jgi:hypothetical protein